MDFGLPELGESQQLLRIPAEQDVAATPRVLAVLDTPAMQRLKNISQLGLVGQVYPGAVHHRFEHSLGVYRLGRLALRHLLSEESEFAQHVSQDELKIFLLSALLHDVGHWPYCHPIEDLRLAGLPHHEAIARELICTKELAQVIEQHWLVDPARVADCIAGRQGQSPPVLQNLLSGPVDIDKMDYLQRDSLHAGVPYGRNFDVGRLISSLCIGRDGRCIAVTQKGKTAAEMMVFARYVMFSEVYWHHTVRSATAMLQRLVTHIYFEPDGNTLAGAPPTAAWLQQSDTEFAAQLLRQAEAFPDAASLAQGLFGPKRALYKRLAEFSFADDPQLFGRLARRPYLEIVQTATHLADRLSRHLDRPLAPTEILIDAPPVKLEVQFKIDIRRPSPSGSQAAQFVPLEDVSPVVRALATEQFDNFVKRIRIFIAPERLLAMRAQSVDVLDELLSVL